MSSSDPLRNDKLDERPDNKPDKMLAVGLIRSSHGVKGYLKVRPFSGETGHLFGLKEVFVLPRKRAKKGGEKGFKAPRERCCKIEDIKPLGDEVIIKFAGVDSPETARELSNHEMWVSRESAAPLIDGEYYIADLYGATLFYAGRAEGKVIGISETGAADLLEVQTPEGVRIVPFNNRFIGEVDTALKRIELLVRELLD